MVRVSMWSKVHLYYGRKKPELPPHIDVHWRKNEKNGASPDARGRCAAVRAFGPQIRRARAPLVSTYNYRARSILVVVITGSRTLRGHDRGTTTTARRFPSFGIENVSTDTLKMYPRIHFRSLYFRRRYRRPCDRRGTLVDIDRMLFM